MPRASRPRLGELLVRAGVITPEQADAAAAVHRANERTIGQQLLADDAVTEIDLAAALSYQLDVPFVSLRSYPIDDVAALLTPPDVARRHRLVVVGVRDDEILVAMADPADVKGRDALAERIGRRIVPLLALESEVIAELDRRGLVATATDAGPRDRAPEPARETVPSEGRSQGELVPFPRAAAPADEPAMRRDERIPAELAPEPQPAPPPAPEPMPAPEPTPVSVAPPPPIPVQAPAPAEPAPLRIEREPQREAERAPAVPFPPRVDRGPRDEAEHASPSEASSRARAGSGAETQIVRFFLAQAIRDGASDVHVEPLADRLRVRYRVEGALREVTQLPRDMAAPVAARIRSLAAMERDDPQGRLVIREDGREAAFDVTAVSTLWGEKIVMRLIERGAGTPDLDDLAMEGGTLERWRELLRTPYGLLLVAGAPGMGKTTTLYASVRELPTATKDVTTVEDPVAYALEGVNQVQVDRSAGASAAATLRRVLAQEPDVVMVSDLKEKDACEVAMNAALGGRLVLSSLQAPDGLGALYRLVALGADPYLVSASVVGVLAQVLVPRLCEHCRVATQPAMIEAALLRQAGLPADRVFSARGCARCNGTGRRGRVAAFELLMPAEELRAAIERGAKVEEAREILARQGIVTLREAGLRLVTEGLTSTHDVMTRLPAAPA